MTKKQMTKKHFKALAEAIRTVKDEEQRENLTALIGEVCDKLNFRFDWDRWEAACRGEKYKK